MKLDSAVSKFVTNKWVLNVVAFLALFNVIGYLVMGKLNAVLYFIIFAVLVRYFSKNMTIVLGVPLIFVNLLALKGNMIEGMENSTDNTSKINGEKKSEDQQKIDNLVKNNKNKPDSKTSQGLVITNIDAEASHDTNTGEQQGFEPGRRKNKGSQIDYAATIEDAYDELNNILGSDGIQRLTNDTQNLMKQQMQLAESMKGIGKLVENIQPMVEQLKGMMGDSNSGMAGVMDLAKKMSTQSAPAK